MWDKGHGCLAGPQRGWWDVRRESYVPCNSPVGRLGRLDEHLGLKQRRGVGQHWRVFGRFWKLLIWKVQKQRDRKQGVAGEGWVPDATLSTLVREVLSPAIWEDPPPLSRASNSFLNHPTILYSRNWGWQWFSNFAKLEINYMQKYWLPAEVFSGSPALTRCVFPAQLWLVRGVLGGAVWSLFWVTLNKT